MADPDIIQKYIPALSSTGDVPVFLSPPPDAGEGASPPALAPDPKDDESAASPTADPEGGENQDDIRSPGLPAEPSAEETTEAEPPPVEAKPDPRTARIRAAEERARVAEERSARQAEMLERALAALEERAAAIQKSAEALAKPTPPPDPKPSRADFDNPEDYDAALVQWGTRAALAEHDAKVTAERAAEKAAADKKAADDRAAEQQKAIDVQWQQRRREAVAKRADYEEIQAALIEATNEFNGQQTAAMTAAIMSANDGPDLAYYLGKNPAEAKRIALMGDPMLQLFEMGKISAKLAQPKPVEVSRTPAPIAPLRGPAPAAEKEPGEMTMDEYAAYKARKRQAEAQGRRPH